MELINRDYPKTEYLDIFLPFYGDVALFKETVLSVVNQDTTAWRLTIINDAHPDYSVDEWVSEFRNSNIRYFRNESNLGPSRNFARCLEFATSSHCLFLGADDLLLPNYVSVVLRELGTNPNISLIQPGVRVVDEVGAQDGGLVDLVKRILWRINGYGLVEPKRAIATLMIGSWMYFPSLVWSLEKVKEFGFDPRFNVCADLDLIIKVLDSGGGLVVLKDVLFAYRRHFASDSAVKLLDGKRFKEERELHNLLARHFWRSGKPLIAILAALHLSSRLHAAVILPKTLKSNDAFLKTLRHIFL